MNILQSMGIQAWRLRPSKKSVEVGLEIDPTNDIQVDNTPETQYVPQATDDHRIRSQGFESSLEESPRSLGVSQGTSASLLQAVDLPNKSESGSADRANELGHSEESEQKTVPTVIPHQIPTQSGISSSAKDDGIDESTGSVKESLKIESAAPHPDMPQLRPAPVPLDDNVPDLTIEPVNEAVQQEDTIEETLFRPSIADQIDDGPGWRELQKSISADHECPSCGKNKSILGQGDVLADWMFVTSAPTNTEIAADTLLLGRQGTLYEAILKACRLDRSTVYTTSVFKCAPPEDLSLQPTCNRLIHRQIELVAPRTIIVFGEFAAQSVLRTNDSIDRLIDRLHAYPGVPHVSVIVAHSAEEMLTQPLLKASLWSILKTQL